MADTNTPFATRLCLSGLESRRLLETAADFGVRHIQVSYYYLRKVFPNPQDFEAYIGGADIGGHFSTVILDSGTVYHKFKTSAEKEEFLNDYIGYIGGLNKHAISAAVSDPDIELDKVIPDEMIIYPLEDLRKVFDNDLGAIFQNVSYIGVSNNEASKKGGDDLIPVFAQAKKSGAYIHAFGTSSRALLTKFPFYSANSSSWRTGSRYLNTYIYEGPGRGLRLYQPTDKKDALKTEREIKLIRKRQQNMVRARQGPLYEKINWDAVEEGDSWEVDKANLTQWILYQQDQELAPQKKYFLTEQDTQDIIQRKRDLLAKLRPVAEQDNRGEGDRHHGNNSGGNNGGSDSSSDSVESTGHIEGADNSPPNNAEDVDEEVVEGEIVDPPNDPDIPGKEISQYREDSANAGNHPDPAENVVNLLPAIENKHEERRLTPVDDRMKQLRQCDFCSLSAQCPKYTPGGLCAFGLPPENPTYDHNKLPQHVREDAADILASLKDSIMQLALEERLGGAGANKDLDRRIKTYIEFWSLLQEASDQRDSLKVEAKGQDIMQMFKKSS